MRAGEDSISAASIGHEPIDEAIGADQAEAAHHHGSQARHGEVGDGLGLFLGAAEIEGHGVLFFSLEMSDEEIGARMLSDVTFQYDGRGVPYGLIETGQLDAPDPPPHGGEGSSGDAAASDH
jgi:hypothetical protein